MVLKPADRKVVGVQVPLRAPTKNAIEEYGRLAKGVIFVWRLFGELLDSTGELPQFWLLCVDISASRSIIDSLCDGEYWLL
jgi:hypothetical protein